jgi:HD-like signal output (HDOD) protein
MTGGQLARQIERDPVLVGEVIRLANSPYYRRSRRISSIEQAVVLLGRNGLHQLVARVAFYPIFNLRAGRITNLAGARIWNQSERCALVCHCLAERGDADVFAAYLAGLVANVGMMVGFRLMDQTLNREEDGVPNGQEFYRTFIAQAGRLTHRLMTEWDFPEVVIEAVAGRSRDDPREPRSPLGEMLVVADCHAKLSLLLEHRRMREEGEILAVTADPCYRRLSSHESA